MNLLEHYIVKIHSEEKVTNPENKEEYIKVSATVDCYGSESKMLSLFRVDEWEEVKKKGFFMA